MVLQILIALAAGAASALMFVSIISGAAISLVLFYLAPLPLMVAALGWGTASALVGGIAGSLAMGLLLGWPYLAAFALTVALPAYWLCRLALLAKPAGTLPNGAPELEWYPTGRILVWIAGFAALTTITALLSLGSDATTITEALKRGLTRMFGAGASGNADVGRVVSLLAMVAPAAATMVAMLTLTVNLWLSARITRTSGRLARPWPRLALTELPPMTMAVLALALGLTFTEGLAALFSQIIAAALMMAYALTGFAVLHLITQGTAMRGAWLGTSYAAVIVFGWPLLVMTLLGIADVLFGLRRRKLARLGPPST
jgi:hypothetical protein